MSKPFLQNAFLIGNLMLGIALVMLFFLGALWQMLGVWAMVIWMALAGAGMYLVGTDKERAHSSLPD